MARPKTKTELLDLSEINYNKLLQFIDSLSEAQQKQKFPSEMLNRNVRDVLAHLHFWHLLMLGWYKEGLQGIKPAMPAPGFTWKTLPAFNKKVWKDSQAMELHTAKSLLESSYQQVRALIKGHTNDELFEKKRFKWTGTTSLGAYLVSNTSSHYEWAYKLIKKALK